MYISHTSFRNMSTHPTPSALYISNPVLIFTVKDHLTEKSFFKSRYCALCSCRMGFWKNGGNVYEFRHLRCICTAYSARVCMHAYMYVCMYMWHASVYTRMHSMWLSVTECVRIVQSMCMYVCMFNLHKIMYVCLTYTKFLFIVHTHKHRYIHLQAEAYETQFRCIFHSKDKYHACIHKYIHTHIWIINMVMCVHVIRFRHWFPVYMPEQR